MMKDKINQNRKEKREIPMAIAAFLIALSSLSFAIVVYLLAERMLD